MRREDVQVLFLTASVPLYSDKENLDKLMASTDSDQQQPRGIDELKRLLVTYQTESESPSLADMEKITPFALGSSKEAKMKRVRHMTEMTVLTVQLIIEFCKRIPGFGSLCKEDKIVLLKAHTSEVMVLRAARNYDAKTDSIVFANNQKYNIDDFRSSSKKGFADDLFRVCRSISSMQLANEEYALLTAIIILSTGTDEQHRYLEPPGLAFTPSHLHPSSSLLRSLDLLKPNKVRSAFDFYMEALKSHIDEYRPTDQDCFARLLSILEQLRFVGFLSKRQYSCYKYYHKTHHPLLEEIFDIVQ